LLRSISPSTKIVLVESDGRKATFLRQVALKLDLNCDVLNKRIEVISIEENTILSARALATLPKLLDIIEPLTHKDTVCLFMKGKNFSKELKLAQDTWSFDCDVVESRTNAEAAVLVIRNICRAKK